VPIVARNGGHSYGGYSSVDGLVVDLARIRDIRVDRDAETARIGGGSLLIDVYAGLAEHGVAIPAGSCPTVGVSGLALGGGIGLSGRKHGLTSDNLLEIEVVTADGELVVANEREEQDLFWASCGGGGGNFGIATGLTFRVHPVDRVATYSFEWDWLHAAAIFEAWQDLAPDAPDELFSICKLASAPSAGGAKPFVSSFGQFFGSRGELESLLEPLLRVASPTSRSLSDLSFLDAQKSWAGCEASASGCVAQTKRAAYKAKSQYVSTPFPAKAVETMIDWVGRWPGSSSPNGAAIQMDASGGAINRVAADATAFVHRDDLFHSQFLAYWTESDPSHVVDRNLDWIAGFHEAMRPFASGRAYQNYIDPDLDDWQRAYYGANLERLREIKKQVDPDFRFRFRQAIPPAR
jgi:FAD/FMN-containing dehydrogenase